MKAFYVDVAKCNGCHNCQIACKDEHSENSWLPYAEAQPMTGQFWCRVEDFLQGSAPKLRMHYIAHLCNHCTNPLCKSVCRAGAIDVRPDGLVLIDPAKCVGCRACEKACVYGAVFFNEEKKICQKCTGCAHILDNEENAQYRLPRCADACPTDALQFGEESDFADFIDGAQVLQPESGAVPRVYYRNIPGRFIGGCAVDPDEKEVIIGADVRATVGGKTYFTKTDDFGDFWLNDLPVGKFRVVIDGSAAGYGISVFEEVSTKTSVNLGDIFISKKESANA
jgi:Fe-S-cluster-containing dehydrogenase component